MKGKITIVLALLILGGLAIANIKREDRRRPPARRNRYEESERKKTPPVDTRFVKLEVHQELINRVEDLEYAITLLIPGFTPDRSDAKYRGELVKMRAISMEERVARVKTRVRANVKKSQEEKAAIRDFTKKWQENHKK